MQLVAGVYNQPVYGAVIEPTQRRIYPVKYEQHGCVADGEYALNPFVVKEMIEVAIAEKEGNVALFDHFE